MFTACKQWASSKDPKISISATESRVSNAWIIAKSRLPGFWIVLQYSLLKKKTVFLVNIGSFARNRHHEQSLNLRSKKVARKLDIKIEVFVPNQSNRTSEIFFFIFVHFHRAKKAVLLIIQFVILQKFQVIFIFAKISKQMFHPNVFVPKKGNAAMIHNFDWFYHHNFWYFTDWLYFSKWSVLLRECYTEGHM